MTQSDDSNQHERTDTATTDTDPGRIRQELEAALNATDADKKNFHIREALQLLQIEGTVASARRENTDERAN